MKIFLYGQRFLWGCNSWIALVLGVLCCFCMAAIFGFLSIFLGQAFISLINMVIIPLVFPVVVVAVGWCDW